MKMRSKAIAYILSFALLIGMVPVNEAEAAKKVALSSQKVTVQTGKSKTIKVKNAKKKVTWKILFGKGCITLSKKGKVAAIIKGKKKGTAKVQAKCGAVKLICNVTVTDTTNKPATSKPSEPTATPDSSNFEKDEKGRSVKDVEALKKIIAEQRERGATVSEDLDDDSYIWEDGRLKYIKWENENLSGDLDVSGCTALIDLHCRYNQLTSIDISKNTSLIHFSCIGNRISELDVSKNTALIFLDCSENLLDKIDVSKNTALLDLGCRYNKFTDLDVSKNTALESLDCIGNQLSKLDVSKNTALKSLDCFQNQLTTLDLTNNPDMNRLSCDSKVRVIGYSGYIVVL